jgi:hypothetical protein
MRRTVHYLEPRKIIIETTIQIKVEIALLH